MKEGTYMRLLSAKTLLLSMIGASLLCALLIFGTGQASQAHAATLSPASASIVAPRDVPLPDHARALFVVRVKTDGEFANQWKYTVDNPHPDSVVDFYLHNMPDHGWHLVHTGPQGPHGGQLLKYVQGNRICYIEAFLSHEIRGNTTLFITVTN